MDWRTLIEELIASGMTEQSIADAVTRMGPRRVTQPTIHRIKNGTEPKHSVGAALIRLHRYRRRARRHGRQRQGRNSGTDAAPGMEQAGRDGRQERG